MLLACLIITSPATLAEIAQSKVSEDKHVHLAISSRSGGHNNYYTELLLKALLAYGYEPKISYVGVVTYQRQMKFMHDGDISLMWRLRSKQRDAQFMRVDPGLTDGLIGHRVFLIPKDTQHKFNHIQSLSDLQKSGLVGGFGENWFDIDVWQKNGLEYLEIKGKISKIFPMLATGQRGFDYFSRGVNEILPEAKRNPDLEIEQQLLLIYPLDTHFYLGKSAEHYHAIISGALSKAKEDGLMNQLLTKYYAQIKQQLQLEKRRKISLTLP